MAVINTLITATDRTSETLDKVKKKIKNDAAEMRGSLNNATEGAGLLQTGFDSVDGFSPDNFLGILDSIAEISDRLDSATTATQKFLLKMGLVAGGAMALAYGMGAAVNSASDYVNEMNESAKKSNATIEMLQQMQAMFRDTGMEINDFGDINKDVLDHLGDAFRDGSGPADDMKAYGLQLKEYNQYLNQTNGGINAVIHSFYEMRKAGKSQAEIVNMMETLASNSSHLISTLDKYKTEQEAVSALESQRADITADLAEKYRLYELKVKDLQIAFQNWQAVGLAPVVEDLTKIMEMIQGDWSAPGFTEMVKNLSRFVGNDSILSIPWNMVGGASITADINNEDEVNNIIDGLAKPRNKNEVPEGGWINQEKAAAAAAAAQKAAEAAAEKLKTQKAQAEKWLTQLDINNASEQTKAEINYNTQEKQLNEFLSKKLISQKQYEHGIEAINSQYDSSNREQSQQRELQNAESMRTQGLTSENEYQQKVLDIKHNYQVQGLQATLNTEMEYLSARHEAGLIKEDAYQASVAALKRKYDFDSNQENKNYKANSTVNEYKTQADALEKYSRTMSSVSGIASQMGSIIASSAEQGSAAWVAATVVTKAAAIASAIIAANLAAAQVMASPGSLTLAQKIAESNTIRTLGYASAAMIAAQGIAEIAGAREMGGQVQAGKQYIVGEAGPELFTAGATGHITSNKDLSGGGGSVVIHFDQNVTLQGSGIGQADLNQMKDMTLAMIDDKFNNEMRQNGKLAALKRN